MKRILAVLIFVSAHSPLQSAQRLPEWPLRRTTSSPSRPILRKRTFEGDETISIRVLKPTSEITLNAVDIDFHEVTITSGGSDAKS